MIGTLDSRPALERPELLAPSVLAALQAWSGQVPVGEIEVAEIDPEAADTALFCARYEVRPEESANCVVLAAKREGITRLAACVVLATDKADVNGTLRRQLDARKASFASMELAVEESGMEYGGITPIGLPASWPLLVDERAVRVNLAIIGSGVRRSKLVIPGAALAEIPGAFVGAFSLAK